MRPVISTGPIEIGVRVLVGRGGGAVVGVGIGVLVAVGVLVGRGVEVGVGVDVGRAAIVASRA